jgi:hypothetical protein
MRENKYINPTFLTAVSLFAAILLGMCTSFTVLAAPRTMPDGTVFDPEYYAAANPDVVAALGTNPDVLYKHYKNYGIKEGRKPYADAAASAQTAAPQTASSGAYFTIGPYIVYKAYTSSKLTDAQLINNAATAFAYLPPELLNQFFTTNGNTITYRDMAHDAKFATGRVSGYNKQTWKITNNTVWTLSNSAINICTDSPSADTAHMLASTVHEFGHYFDSVMGTQSNTAVWQQITAAEFPASGLNSYYAEKSEYFAEQFAIYQLPDRAVYGVSKSQCPQSQAFIAALVAQYNASMNSK